MRLLRETFARFISGFVKLDKVVMTSPVFENGEMIIAPSIIARDGLSELVSILTKQGFHVRSSNDYSAHLFQWVDAVQKSPIGCYLERNDLLCVGEASIRLVAAFMSHKLHQLAP